MRRTLIALVISALALVGVLGANAATAKTVKFELALKGTNEKPAAPASNKGRVELTLNTTTGKVCWDFKLAKIDGKPSQAHIHKGKAGVSGNVVVPLGATYKRQGCTSAAKSLVKSIAGHPASYYVNVHNAKHPLGAMRGQL
jgi:CHRD domain-containing protein